MKDIAVILSHPEYATSSANKGIIEGLKRKNNSIHVHHLEEIYPTPHAIDVDAEQKLLVQASTIVLQFPCFWYSVPGMMKYWLDAVMTYGFAFGSNHSHLQGKQLILSLTTGGKEESYATGKFTIEEYYILFVQLARLTKMELKPFVVSYGYSHDAKKDYIKQSIDNHVETLWTLLQ